MGSMTILKVGLNTVEEKFRETNEINLGFDTYDRSFFQINDGNFTAYAIIYNVNDFAELARFFVPKSYREKGFGKLAAVSLIHHLFATKSELLIDPLNNSVGFWSKVADQFQNIVNFKNVEGSKFIWCKKNTEK